MRFKVQMKHVLAAALLALAVPGYAGEAGAYFPLWQPKSPNVSDLALLYQGGAQRPRWTLERYAPYVSYRDPRTGKEQWLFDGFLFIEFEDGRGHAFEPRPGLKPAQKAHWLALLDRNFATGEGLPNLEQTCGNVVSRIGQPLRRRQVMLTLPVPLPGQTDWGQLNGVALDFRKSADRLAALSWYMDTALEKWKALAPRQLELTGFYWVHESVPRTNDFHQAVANLVHARGKLFCWIPYWHPKPLQSKLGDWRSVGFDVAWQQPNHFFHPEIADSRLDEACEFARQHGMGLEMEFDGRMLDRTKRFEPRFDAYLDAFIRHGVKQSSSIAYYEGGGALFQLANASEPAMRAHYDRLAQFILERQKWADEQAQRK